MKARSSSDSGCRGAHSVAADARECYILQRCGAKLNDIYENRQYIKRDKKACTRKRIQPLCAT